MSPSGNAGRSAGGTGVIPLAFFVAGRRQNGGDIRVAGHTPREMNRARNA